MRNTFISELTQLAEKNPNIFLVVGDLGYPVVEEFAHRFPDRFLNSGVAEQNMTGLSAGLASEGYHVFIYSIANFPTFRSAEQIRNDIDYHKLPVTVVSVGGGLSYGNLGYSHHAVQDFALLRCMPNMLLACPGDPMEVKACVRYLVDNPQPSYLRLGRAGEINLHSEVPSISPGSWLNVRKGASSDRTFLTTGAILQTVVQIDCPTENDFSIYSVPLWGMNYKNNQTLFTQAFDRVVTVEDHLLDGGFGSWMLESLLGDKKQLSKIEIAALDNQVCGKVGTQQYLNELGGLNKPALLKLISEI